jgi:two-component system OmpR family sensor kinase
MRSGLFWKTVFGFWLAYFAVSVAVSLPFIMFDYHPYDGQLAARVGTPVLEMCSVSIAQSGVSGCSASLAKLQDDDRHRVQILPITGARPVPGCGDPFSVSTQVSAPDGRRYLICYHYPPPPPWPRYILHTPPEVLAMGAIGGLAFGAVLAWYLIVPIQRIRMAFKNLAEGRLGTRVGHTTGGRRDEIADLAHDFDWMASRLEELVSARDRLLHDVSHELRSPLSRLQLAIALARQDGARLPVSLDRIEREAGRLNDLVHELLTLARVESGLSSEEYFDLAGVVESVASDAQFEARARGVEIVADLPPQHADLPSLGGSSELIRRAIDNVLRNSVKFATAGQRIAVNLGFDAAQNTYDLQISDRGPGAPEQALAHLFEPFVKAGDQGGGFGLGLSIAKRAVEAHGGRITAVNQAEGGLLVAIVLPAVKAASGRDSEPQRVAWNAGGRPIQPPGPVEIVGR